MNKDTPKRLIEMERWFNEDEPSPVGRIVYGGYATHRGIPANEMRVLGMYGLIYLLQGEGSYTDVAHRNHQLVPGNLIFLFPEIPHAYGPPEGGHWRELFIHFHGPVFDVWRQSGFLTPESPVRHIQPQSEWLPKLETIVRGPRLTTPEAATGRICDFLKLISMIAGASPVETPPTSKHWLIRACDMLEDDLNEPLDIQRIADVLGMSYSSLRHRFALEKGMSLNQYRTQKRLAAAAQLLRTTDLSQRAIARRVGYSDEFQFSRRFKQVMGVSPSSVRKDK